MISFKLFADTDVGLRDNNEDSFVVNRDLSHEDWEVPVNPQEVISLGKLGCLMVVADGMGGMNAGEVASAIAIQTVQNMFSPSKLPSDVTNKPDSIKSYLKKVIIEADLQVKKHSKENPDTEGMGSTIVMAWIVGEYAYVGWLGDSRAYSHLPQKGIMRLTKDHSYVQELVDAKMLTEEEAMYHDQSNVITRSLGDATQKAKPDVISHRLTEGEIILLCSDGLCGFCTDAEITGIIDDSLGNLKTCHQALINAALEADGSDNITVALLQITEMKDDRGKREGDFSFWKNVLFFFTICAFIAIFITIGHKTCGEVHTEIEEKDSASANDTVSGGNNCDTASNVPTSEGWKDSVENGQGTNSSLMDIVNREIISIQSKEDENKNPEDELERTNGDSGAPVKTSGE